MIKTAHAGNFTQKKTKEIRVKDSLVSNRDVGYVCFVLFPGEFLFDVAVGVIYLTTLV